MAVTALTTQEYFQNAYQAVKFALPDLNIFSTPKILKVSINVGVGKYESKQKQEIADYLAKLTGQKPKEVGTKKAVANFKTRKGDLVGLSVTLRGVRAQDFLFGLIFVALPRTRDFKGVKQSSFDKNFSCYSLGIDSAAIFPAIGFDTSVNFGMQVNIVFKSSTLHNKLLLEKLQFPFKKD